MTATQHSENLSVQFTNDLGVDRANRVIKGAKVIEMGQLNDMRPWQVDMETLERVVELGNRPNKGIKARYKHPSMFGDSLGSHLGRWKNFRIDEDAVRADLHLAKSASSSPEGDLASYVMDLAEEDSESFGVSLAPKLSEEMFSSDEDLIPIRIEALNAVDTVGEPAATRGGLFNVKAEEKNSMANDTSKETPAELASQPEPKVEFSIEKASELAKPYLENFGAQGAQWFLEGKDLVECFKAHVGTREDEIECLKQEVLSLEERLQVALANQGESEELSQSVEMSEQEKKEAEFAAKAEVAKKQGVPESAIRWSRLFEKRS